MDAESEVRQHYVEEPQKPGALVGVQQARTRGE